MDKERMRPKDRTETLIEGDLLGAAQRIREFQNEVASADTTVLAFGCSDARVQWPKGPVKVLMENGEEKSIMFVGVSIIGSGLASRRRFYQTVHVLQDWGAKDLMVLATQHGDSDEIAHAKNHTSDSDVRLTCGLRNFMGTYKKELTEIRSLLMPWNDEYKRKTGDITKAPDRMELSKLTQECPDIMELIRSLSEKTGPEGYRIPQRLILRAAYRNSNFDIEENGEMVRKGLAEYLRHPDHKEIYRHCRVGLADYDHKKKTLSFLQPYATLGFADHEIVLPGVTPRTDAVQLPHHAIISFGQESIPIHNGVILPHIAGDQAQADNVFSANASIPTYQTLLCAVSETMYAVMHKVRPHHGDTNFSTLKDVVIICENNRYTSVVDEMVQTEEFSREFRPMLHELNGGKIYVVNLHRDTPDISSELSVVSV